jgi:hypothetical protein
MRSSICSLVIAGGFIAMAASACAEARDEPDIPIPTAEVDSLTPAATAYFSSYSITASPPTPNSYWDDTFQTTVYTVTGNAVSSGSGSFANGACVLFQTTSQSCNTTSDCSPPFSWAGGANTYCVTPEGSSTKSCWYKGPSSGWCTGSPATGSPGPATTHNPGPITTYGSGWGWSWLTYACLNMGATCATSSTVYN